MKVELSEQVVAFVRRQAPEPRRRLKAALRALAQGRGDLRNLEGALAGYGRLRVGGFRIILVFAPGSVVRCLYAEQRSVVYEVFEEQLLQRLRER